MKVKQEKTMNIYRHGDISFHPVPKVPTEIETALFEETILPCGCHKVNALGEVFSRLEQYSEKGKEGFQTKVNDEWKKLSATNTARGYLQVNIHGKLVRLNRLIAETFIDNPLALPEVRHLNDVKNDNRVSNLAWGTAKDNAVDRARNGRTAIGAKNAMAKLDDERAANIFAASGSLNSIAKTFGVSKKLVLLIKQKKAWRHIHDGNVQNEVVAYGEATGHSHNLVSRLPFKMLRFDEKRYLGLTAKTKLDHPEHGLLCLAPGIYEIKEERTFDYFENSIKKVID